jgi:hypothetical protein
MGSGLLVVAVLLPACGGVAGLRTHGKDAGQGGNVEAGGGVSAGGSGAASPTGGSAPTGAGGAMQTGGVSSASGVSGTLATLTVSFAGQGAGTVLLQPGGTVCTAPTTCSASFAIGTAVTLTAKPTNAGATVTSVLSRWDGACAGNGPYRLCTLTMNAATSTAAHFDALPANLVFVTSSVFAGNLGGAAAYERQCNKLATAAGINNAAGDAYVAWMAASDYAPATLLGSTRGWVRADLLPWIDSMATALATGAVFYPVAYDENGQRVIGNTLSGMVDTDALYAGENCNDWTDATVNTSHGHTHAGGRGWPSNNVGVSSCAIASRVLCVMKGANTPVAVTPVMGKKIYLSKSAWFPGGGLSAADAKCLLDAPVSVTAAKAILVGSARALSDVLGATTVYVRPDGVRVGTGAEIIQAMNDNTGPASIEATVTQDGGGSYVSPWIEIAGRPGYVCSMVVWTGLTYPLPGNGDTCLDWTSSSSTDYATSGCIASGWSAAGKCSSDTCNNDSQGTACDYLQCAEQ